MSATVFALGFSNWKRRTLKSCFPGQTVRFVDDWSALPDGAILVVWGMRDVRACPIRLQQVIRVEDGFLRSVGLGADLIRPLSWVLDTKGMYYNAQQVSDLETLLNHAEISADLLARAGDLHQRILAAGLTKYNVGAGVWSRPADVEQVILVPGQVESDASLAFGASGIRHNMALLQAVRAAHPRAWLVYKPHPDVVAGLRAVGQDESLAGQWCDEILHDVPMGAILPQVDEVHVLTSLTGFEALLRGKRVVCYGQPFYSGWGLTQDQMFNARRTRVLSLEQLIACCLILYPRYFSRDSRHSATPEQALDTLQQWQQQRAGPQWLRQGWRFILRSVVGVR
ncbi:beta-3-deoxy-D-manno-oct-2-ulosonic acid transferase [Deefgea sp. CFH1-16]|uniref:capsular polysaccharide export protein, LipB/KpsS family n=1 Tax=Deefgea sp. CFH1-16 TaxID=2675457 RepID=UPI0015F6EF75|nr:beta-3-deoxy-D-manno-oct-2-ulosonic acid transferase [Deefgea sp. CFH1-16]MBM5574145.1 beta-3-deoxy-D-manno-oct-2-ulosonic acid transferase [Deefgea sp. CFH1-16]